MSAHITERITDAGRAPPRESEPVRVLLADLEGAARRALADLLHGLDGVSLAAEVGTREAIAEAMRRFQPHVVDIDDRLVVASASHILAGFGPLPAPARLIVVGVDDHPAYAARAHRLGAHAWIAKDRAADELPQLLLQTT
jgi:DNA-binding NarL/FixJ family response regulator